MEGVGELTGTKKRPEPTTAADRRTVVRARVATPHRQVIGSDQRVADHGIEAVHRVQDTIDAMYRRHQLTPRQFQAAERYRNAVDTLASGGGSCTLDPDKGGGSSTNRTPSPVALMAADDLNFATLRLGMIDGSIVWHIAGRGESIQECAQRFMAEGIDRRRRHEVVRTVSDRLKAALDILANGWFPSARANPKLRGWVTPDHEPQTSTQSEVKQGRTAHASRGKLDWSGR